jgi:hypothetical protein
MARGNPVATVLEEESLFLPGASDHINLKDAVSGSASGGSQPDSPTG